MTSSLNKLYTYAHNLPAEPKRFVKFLFVGAMGFAVDFGLFNLIHTLYDVPGTQTDELIAQAISFTCAVLANFAWNYFWLYPEARGAKQSRKVAKFFVVSVAGLAIRTPIFNSMLSVYAELVHQAGLDNFPLKLPGNLALGTAVLVVLLWNFFVNRYWTYRDVK